MAALVVGAVLAVACGDGGPAREPDAAPPATIEDVGVSPTAPEVPPPTIRSARIATAPVPVAPQADAALAPVRRDCGFSQPLPAGGVVWVFCDTTFFDPEGHLRWFVNTSAALATAEDPFVLLDHVGVGGRVLPVVEATPDHPACAPGEGRFTWPTSGALVEPGAGPAAAGSGVASGADGGVLALWYHNVCVVPGDFVGHDTGVALLDLPDRVDAASPPSARPRLRARVVDARLLPAPPGGVPFGQAAVRVDDLVYLYRCLEAGPCQVARVPAVAEAVGDLDRYEVWTGSAWVPHGSDGAAAGPMAMPEAVRGLKPSVTRLPDGSAYLFVDHRVGDPGEVLVRVAATPWGPWSPPTVVDLPGCDAGWPDVCFAVEAHGHLSPEGHVALTWFDPAYPRATAAPLRTALLALDLAPGGDG